MVALKNMAGLVFGRLTVLGRAENTPSGQARWRCRCECGREIVSAGQPLRGGHSTSCGCRRAEVTRNRSTTHGHTANGRFSPEYAAWANMQRRCSPLANPEDCAIYYDRGITVCDRWRDSFEAFLADMGERPANKTSIDRIDNDRGYEPGNCRWADWHEQRMNQRHMKAA